MDLKIGGKWSHIFLFLIIAFFLVNNMTVVYKNQEPFRGDALYEYGKSSRAFHRLKDLRFENFAEIIFRSEEVPLFFLVTMPFYFMLGNSQLAASFVSQIYLVILLIGTYLLGKHIWNRKVGIFSSLILGSFPLIYSFSRTYQHQMGGLALLPFTIFLMLKTEHFENFRYSILFAIFAGLGVLHRDLFSVFLVGPFLSYLWMGRSELLDDKTKTKAKNLAISFGLGLLIVLSLVIPAWNEITADIKRDMEISYWNPYSRLSLEGTCYYLLRLPEQITPVLSILFFISVSILMIRYRDLKEGEIVVAFWFILPYIIYNLLLYSNQLWSNTLLYIPSIALLISFGIKRLGKRSTLIMTVVGAVAIFQFLAVSYWPYHGLSSDNYTRLSGTKYPYPSSQRKVIYYPRKGGFTKIKDALCLGQDNGSEEVRVSYLLTESFSYRPEDLNEYAGLEMLPEIDICANPKGYTFQHLNKTHGKGERYCKNASYSHVLNEHDVIITESEAPTFRIVKDRRYRAFGEKITEEEYKEYKSYYKELTSRLENTSRKVYEFKAWKNEFKLYVL